MNIINYLTRRTFYTSNVVKKRMSKTNLTNLCLEIKKPTEKLDPLERPTGSIVLDTVREYTRKYPLCVLLVQVGDFYELYESHAKEYANQLDLKLTRKAIASGVTVDFAGFPSRSLERYLDILVNRLQCKVAICEQLGPVTRQDNSVIAMDRKITRVITPGTVIEERFLDSNQYNYLLAISPQGIGLAWADVSVGELVMQHTTLDNLKDDLARIRPREVILPESMRSDPEHEIMKLLAADTSIVMSFIQDADFNSNLATRTLTSMFKRFSVADYSEPELSATMALFNFVNDTLIQRKPKWQLPTRFCIDDSVRIDSAAMSSLEIVKTLQGKKTDSLLSVLDRTCTSAGSRLLTRWISSPLTSIHDIRQRLDAVQSLTQDGFLLDDVRNVLKQSTDTQRALQRLVLGRGQHSDLLEVCGTLDIMKVLREKLGDVEQVDMLLNDMDPHESVADYIKSAFNQDHIRDGNGDYGYVNHAFEPALLKLDQELNDLKQQRQALQDELRALCGNSVMLMTDNGPYKHMIEMNTRQASTFINNYPHAIELNHTKSKKRFQMEAWTTISIQLENCESQIIEIENQVFDKVVNKVLDQSTSILLSCRKLAELDVLSCFAYISIKNQYIKPRITQTNRTLIVGGRHPVVEQNLAKKGKSFVSNDCDLSNQQKIWLLTGPNMGGKSTFLRQHVIIVIMAHMGCFVPADRAWIGVTDRIFSRVGAADNLAQNQSTFMVEMSEVSTILKQATSRSTVIMDEVGRGTSTQDGFSLAYGILDYLSNQIKCRTLFATHYHELADVVHHPHVKFYQTSVEENEQGGFRFIHKVKPGVCKQSHGIKVAQIAGLPKQVIQTAQEVWQKLQKSPTHQS